jgi:hypothetical protein
MSQSRPSLWAVRVEVGWWLLQLPAVALACLLGADALARIGACRFSLMLAGQLFVCIGTLLLLRPPYQLAAVSFTLVTGAIIGLMRTTSVVLHAVVDGVGIPSVSGGYVFRAFLYGAYVVGYWWVNRLAERALEADEP